MSKQPATFEQQIFLLESRGLVVSDRALALHRLAHANYFRLNCYRHPFQIPGTDTFSPGSQQTLEVNLDPALKRKANKVLGIFPR